MAFTINDEEVYPIGYYTSTGERKQPTASDGEVDQIIDLRYIANPVVIHDRTTGETTVKNVQNEPVGYRSAYHPEDIVPFFNTLTLGGLNNLSPTQWLRRGYDTGKLLNGNMNWTDYSNSWIHGNNGIFTDQQAAAHPVWAAIGNGAADILTLGGAGLLKSTAGQYRAGQAATQAFNNGTWDYIVGATSPNAGLRTTLVETPQIPYYTFFTPEVYYSKEITSPYYKVEQNGQKVFDIQNVLSQIKLGKQDFINEMTSPEYAEAAIRNMEEAEKMGLSYTPVFEKPAFKSLREDGIIPKFVQDPKHTWHAKTQFLGGTPGKATEIEYNVSRPSNIRQSTGHESGHISRWGMGETKEEYEFMKHKVSQIFKDDADVGVYDLRNQTGEAATNMRDLGKQMGITQRTPYPGYEEALRRLKEAEITSNKGGIVKVLKLTKEAMPHIWRALQGLHFQYIGPTAATATLYSNSQ